MYTCMWLFGYARDRNHVIKMGFLISIFTPLHYSRNKDIGHLLIHECSIKTYDSGLLNFSVSCLMQDGHKVQR